MLDRQLHRLLQLLECSLDSTQTFSILAYALGINSFATESLE